jgi:4-aminobutyrate aminotransferase-like enzyme
MKDDTLQKGKKALLSGWGEMGDLVVTGGEGAVFKDIDGKEYIDCTSQAWSLNTGYNNPRVMRAAREQLDKITHVRSTFHSEPQLRLAARLSDLAPGSGEGKLSRVSFSLHGSVATEGAIKLALNRKDGRLMALFNGYHGRTMASMSLSWPHPNLKLTRHFFDVVRVPGAYCYRCSYGLDYPSCGIACADFIEETMQHSGPVSSLFMEAIQGNGGQITFPAEFHAKVREICDRNDVLLVYDEVQTGFARVPAMFACELYDVVPDVIIYGKGIGGGFPLAGTLSRPGLPKFEPGDHGFTFGHFPLSLAAALENLDVIEEERLLERCGRLGAMIMQKLTELQNEYELIGEVRGEGLMIGIELVKNRKKKTPAVEECQAIAAGALERGVLFGTSRYHGMGNVLKIKPPVVISEEQIDRALHIFEVLLAEQS